MSKTLKRTQIRFALMGLSLALVMAAGLVVLAVFGDFTLPQAPPP